MTMTCPPKNCRQRNGKPQETERVGVSVQRIGFQEKVKTTSWMTEACMGGATYCSFRDVSAGQRQGMNCFDPRTFERKSRHICHCSTTYSDHGEQAEYGTQPLTAVSFRSRSSNTFGLFLYCRKTTELGDHAEASRFKLRLVNGRDRFLLCNVPECVLYLLEFTYNIVVSGINYCSVITEAMP